jgi:hypothetical protein
MAVLRMRTCATTRGPSGTCNLNSSDTIACLLHSETRIGPSSVGVLDSVPMDTRSTLLFYQTSGKRALSA